MENIINEKTIIAKKYKIISKLGEGKFGLVFKAINIESNEIVAIKTEELKTPYKLLKNETKILKYLYDQGSRCIPMIYWYGIYLDKTCLVFSCFSFSLHDYIESKEKIDIKLISNIMKSCIEVLESIHKHYVLHRDIKPQNFMYRDGEIYLIDFGLATFYIDENGKHIENKKDHNEIIGSTRYASYNIHCGDTYSRRDDMISLGYMYLWMVLEYLPWDINIEIQIPDSNGNGNTTYLENHLLHRKNVFKKKKKSWESIDKILIEKNMKNTNIYRYLDYCYRLDFECSPIHELLENIF
uniref:non-specific serine/threonine protein kinase n=1 Tax=viral metagenome TaxID=1070528 RepID=A0A6C0HT94_9ZZZZ